MKNFFIRLFNYDRFASESILKVLLNSSQPEKAVQLMTHLLMAQQIWYNRCNDLPLPAGALWQNDGKIDEFAASIVNSNGNWIAYLETLTDGDFDKTISYNNLKGEPFESKLSDILMQVINHGTHHRAQIGQQLKFAGTETLPVTDYIAFTRQIND
jgi:uncharacterized damage-inducible protein DinB